MYRMFHMRMFHLLIVIMIVPNKKKLVMINVRTTLFENVSETSHDKCTNRFENVTEIVMLNVPNYLRMFQNLVVIDILHY